MFSARSCRFWLAAASSCWWSASCFSCIALTMMAMKRFSTAKVVARMKTMKKIQACGCCAITGRTISADQPSSVMIWNSV